MTNSGSGSLFLGIDLGGTNIKSGVVDEHGVVISSVSIPTEGHRGAEHGVGQICLAGQTAISLAGVDASQIVAAGLATPGTMDIPAGMLLEPTNLEGWDHFPIRRRVSELLNLPAVLQNDANAAAYGEYWAGQARHVRSLAFYTLGTGLGGGLIIDDHIIEGEHSHGAELGHVILEMDHGRLCNTGQYGTAEAYVSATALLKRCAQLLECGAETILRPRLAQGEALSPLMMTQAAESGDEFSLGLILEMARYLGAAITSVVHAIDPAMVLLGGAMTFGRHDSPVGRAFLDQVRNEFRRRTFPTLAEKTKIDYASLGGDAGFIGAAGCACLAAKRGRLFNRE